MSRPTVFSGRILIADDDERQRTALVAMLSDCSYDIQVAADGQHALERLATFNADVIVADLVMPRMDGFELLQKLHDRGDLTPAIALTGFGSIEKALSAIHDLNAFWFLEKPVEPRAFKILLARAIQFKRSLQKTEELQRDLSIRGVLGDLVGTSPAMQQIFSLIRQVAPTPAPVLIGGESGTGKELVAREIHQRSRRTSKPLIRVNCASIPKELYESEFFGHARGAFTGAIKDRAGRFETAEGGTIFLDEIGEVPLELQSKLLRVLQEKRYERVGEDRTRLADVRIVGATNRDLKKEVAAGRFREDLYYRLNVFPIQVPA